MGASQSFANNVHLYCNRHGIDVKEVCEKAGHSPNYLNKPKRGEGRIALEDAVKIADILGVYVSALLLEGEYSEDDL